ncbi:MAG: family 2 glycosyl transferase [Verrucomicrobiales bacterium]|nr:family 2 glycosyl transferase [Verrucomicrobiales bacterium]
MSEQIQHAFETARSGVVLTVAICTRNRVGFLEKAIASVLEQMMPCVELLIIDNASTDETPKYAQAVAAANSIVRYLREEELGLSAARNTALKCALGTYVLFLDDDAVAKTGWVEKYLSFITKHGKERIGCVGGPVFPAYEKEPPAWFAPNWNLLDYYGETRALAKESPWGGNSAFNKEAAISIGAFNPKLGRRGNFSGAYEESDLIRRMRESQWQIWWLADAGIDHFIPARRILFKALLRERFDGGRSSAIIRLKGIPSALGRNAYRALRICGEPFQCLLNGLIACLAFLLGRKQRAAHMALKFARSAGFSYQMLQIKKS